MSEREGNGRKMEAKKKHLDVCNIYRLTLYDKMDIRPKCKWDNYK